MKNIITKAKITIAIIIAVILITIFIIGYNVSNKYNDEKQVIEETDTYTIKIDYPEIENNDLRKKVYTKITEYKEEFLKNIKGNKIEQGAKFDFSITYTNKKMNDINALHIITYSFVGDNHYIRYDDSYHFNEKSGQVYSIEYFLANENSTDKLKKEAYKYIIKYLDENKYAYDEEMVNEGINEENIFKDFYLSNNGLGLIFPPMTVAANYVGEVNIEIPYEQLENILKEEFIIKKEEESNIKKSKKRDLEQFKNKKLIAFTFDDGPSNQTNYLLDHLDEYDARVTFFVLGSRVEKYKETIKRSYEMGNQIGSHTYSHVNLVKLKDYNVLKEIQSTNKAVKDIIGEEPTVLRPPYGSINEHIKELADMNIVLWNVDTLDWKSRNKDKVQKEIIKTAKDGSIILLHDLYQSSVEGAMLAMKELKKDGYAFVTIDEMMELKKINANEKKTYYSFK